MSQSHYPRSPWQPIIAGVGYYYLTTLVVVAAMWFSFDLLRPQYDFSHRYSGLAARFLSWDGMRYAEIIERGYSYNAERRTNAAFFPAYPMVARFVRWLTGWPAEVSLLVVAHACLLGVFVLLHAYAKRRCTDQEATCADLVILAFGLWPTSLFFRMAYSESLFLLVALGAMYAMERQVRPIWVALIVGLATACRPVGVALLAPMALYLWQWTTTVSGSACPRRDVALRTAVCFPLGCWGIAAFMMFQYSQFGDALAFVKQHEIWSHQPAVPYLERLAKSLLLEPIWSVYYPGSPGYWASHHDAPQNAAFSLPFANPIYFVLSVALVWLGYAKRWLNSREIVLAAVLLAIAYFIQGHRNYMLSQGRFAAVVFPVYIVLGRLAARVPTAVVGACAALSALLLALYAAQFAAWYRVT